MREHAASDKEARRWPASAGDARRTSPQHVRVATPPAVASLPRPREKPKPRRKRSQPAAAGTAAGPRKACAAERVDAGRGRRPVCHTSPSGLTRSPRRRRRGGGGGARPTMNRQRRTPLRASEGGARRARWPASCSVWRLGRSRCRRPASPERDPHASRSRPIRSWPEISSTGELGVAVQSHWFSVGSVVAWAESGVGAVATQSFVEVAYGPRGLDAMRGGLSPEEALASARRAGSAGCRSTGRLRRRRRPGRGPHRRTLHSRSRTSDGGRLLGAGQPDAHRRRSGCDGRRL